MLTVFQEPAGSGYTCNTGEQTTWNCLVAMCCWGGVYLIWICTHRDWLITAENLSNFSNFLLSMFPTCIAFSHDILPGVMWNLNVVHLAQDLCTACHQLPAFGHSHTVSIPVSPAGPP